MSMTAEDKRRCAQCTLVALGVFPKMLQELLANTNIKPDVLYKMILNQKRFKNRLRPDEVNAWESLLTDDFQKLDVGLMYKIFKTFHLIDEPTRDWGPCPSENDIEIGDDVERIRRARNDLFHKIDPYVSEQLYEEFFEKILAVSKRLDTYLNKNADSSYQKLVQEYKLETIDTTTEETLLRDRAREGCFEIIAKCILESRGREIHIMAQKTLIEDLKRCAFTEEKNQRRLEEENQRQRLEEENQRKRLEEENRRRLKEENRRRLEEENRRRLEEENRRRLKEENRRRLEEENRRRLEEENQRRRLEEEYRIRLEEENRRRLKEENQRRRLEEENRRRLEELNQRRRLEEENRRRLEEENRRRFEEENRRRQEEETRKKLEEERKRQEEKDRRQKKEKDLNEEVQFWKTVRNETLPNLERLRQELQIANEKLKNAVAATLFRGALFSIFTGGASMAAAVGAVAVTGAAGITLLIEKEGRKIPKGQSNS